MVQRAPKHRKRQQLRKRLRTYVSVRVTTDQDGTRGAGIRRDTVSGRVVERESASLPDVTGDERKTLREFESIAHTGTQAVTVEVSDYFGRRKLRHFQSIIGYRLLNDSEPIQTIGKREFFGIGLRGFHPGTELTDETVDWLKRQTWVDSVQVACVALSGNGTEYRRHLDQLAANKKPRKTHDPLRKRSGNWGN